MVYYALHNLIFLPPLLLQLLFLIHGCPVYVDYLCPDFQGISLLFPFTNCSLPDCGYCILECNNGSTKAQCGGQKLSYKIKEIFPKNNTIILAYPGLAKLTSDVCKIHQNESAIIPDPPFASFTISHLEVFFRCPLNHSDSTSSALRKTTCGNDTLYGPYPNNNHPQDEEFPPGCSRIQLPSSADNNFSVEYEFPDECSDCLADRSRCFDPKTRNIQCPKKVHSPGKGRRRLGIILGTVLPGILLIFLAFLILFWRQRKTKQGSSAFPPRSIPYDGTRSDLEEGVTVFSYNELEKATNCFASNRELGEGGFGIVYYGKLKDGREVAVKRLHEKNYKRIEQFKNEIQILTGLQHKNLVTLYGCTSRHSRELLLVYEYIPNGTVADHLHGDQSELISWSTRMNIAIETAEALSYLHQKDIIHRDVKTNNLLLGNSFSVKVADFGLSRLFPADVSHVSTAPQGTPGYLDPVYHHCYHLTEKSDVYSFGVVLVELISSLPAVDVGRDRDEINLSSYAMNKIQCCAFSELVDLKLGYETDFKVRRMTTMVSELAFQCLQQEREHRPSMHEVLQALKRILSLDYDALEEEEKNMIMSVMRSPSSGSVTNDYVGVSRDAQKRVSSSPNSVMDKWLSKSSTPNSVMSSE